MDEHEEILREMEERIVSHEEGMKKLRDNYQKCVGGVEYWAAERKRITAGLPRFLETREQLEAFNAFITQYQAGECPEIKGYRIESSEVTEVTYYCYFDQMEIERYRC